VVSDLTEDAWSEVGPTGEACGCSPGVSPLTGSILVLLGGLLVRRRRG
jgi:hypothetical protein